MRPQPTVPGMEWEGVLDATKDGEPCAQAALGIVAGVEDCLNLYVYTPKVGVEKGQERESRERGKRERNKDKKQDLYGMMAGEIEDSYCIKPRSLAYKDNLNITMYK